MRFTLYIAGILFLQGLPETCRAQSTNERYPVQFTQFFRTLSFINPALPDDKGKLTTGFYNQFFRGPFNQLNTTMGELGYNLSREDKRTRNIVGLNMISDKEGTLLRYTSAYLRYAIHLPISSTWKMAAGISAGLVNFSADQTVSSRPVSSYSPDVLLGIGLYSERNKLGISVGQIPNGTLRTDQASIKLPLYLNLFFQKKIPLSRRLELLPALMVRLKNTQVFPVNADANVRIIISKLLLGGINYGYFRGLSFHAGLNELKFLSNPLNITFSYNTSYLSNSLSGMESMEVSVQYCFLKKPVAELSDE